jgi:hypothetical protein
MTSKNSVILNSVHIPRCENLRSDFRFWLLHWSIFRRSGLIHCCTACFKIMRLFICCPLLCVRFFLRVIGVYPRFIYCYKQNASQVRKLKRIFSPRIQFVQIESCMFILCFVLGSLACFSSELIWIYGSNSW